MQYLDLSDHPDNVIVCGDTHGDFEMSVYDIGRRQITDTTVTVAGDYGFGFCRIGYYDSLYKRKLHKKLAEANVLLLMLRGNHDDPIYFEKELIDYPCMEMSPDYTIVHIADHNTLRIGGAVSQDKNFCISMMSIQEKGKVPLWWTDGLFVFKLEELQVLEDEFVYVDATITHPASSSCPPHTKGDFEYFCANDKNLTEDVRQEREGLNKVYEWLSKYGHPLRYWYYGYHHQSATYEHNGMFFHLLNINELKELLTHNEL